MIKINKLIKISESKGDTIEWCKGIKGKQVTIFQRNKGSVSGNHYHKGEDPSKNPERFLLIKGKVKLITRYQNIIIEPYTELIIPPLIKHSLKALEDSIFIEYRTTVFDKNNSDTYK